jgi:hypothetical protein
MIQELTDLRDYIHSSSKDSTQLSTLDTASPTLSLLNQNLYKWRTTNRVWYLDFHREGGIYRGESDLHRHGEVNFMPGGGQLAKKRGRSAGCSVLHHLSPLTQASPTHVDMWQPKLGLNHLKPWPAGQGVGPVG